MRKTDYIIGIDEAGRGPLAGPVYVGCVLVPNNFDFGQFSNLDDSKQMTELQREKVFTQIQEMKEGVMDIQTAVAYTKASTIDKRGIVSAIQAAIQRGVNRLQPNPETTRLYLDGGLVGPKKFPYQKTIVGGDGIEPVISLASVIAKVSRDRKMRRAEKKFPTFKFSQHKGYGTAAHRHTIKKHGPSKIHRMSFIQNLIN